MRPFNQVLLVLTGLLCVYARTEAVARLLRVPEADGEPVVRREVSGGSSCRKAPALIRDMAC